MYKLTYLLHVLNSTCDVLFILWLEHNIELCIIGIEVVVNITLVKKYPKGSSVQCKEYWAKN